MVRYITDKDFIPTTISHCNLSKTDVEKGLYQLVYSVLNPLSSYDDIYELVITIINEHKSMVVKRFYLESWSKEVQAIIDKLDIIHKQNTHVLITIPFFEYINDIPFTRNRFQFVKFAVDEIFAKGEGQMEACDKPKNYPLGELDEIFDRFWVMFERRLSSKGRDEKIPYYHMLMHDELHRRGFVKVTETVFGEKERHTILPSEYYNQPNRFLGILDLNDDCQNLKIKFEKDSEEENGGKSGNGSDRKVNAKEMAGIIYFMLKETFQDTFEKGDKKKLVEFVNCLLDFIVPDPERQKDTARNYIDAFKRIPKVYQSQRFYSIVKDTLKQYNFGIPEAIKEATEITTKHIKVR